MDFSPLLLIVPALTIGPRSLYAFELLPAVLAVLLLLSRKTRTTAARFLFIWFLLAFSLLATLSQVVLLGDIRAMAFFRLLNLAILFIMMVSILENDARIKRVAAFSFSAAIVFAYGQIVDGQFFSNSLGINRLVATLYPYTGALDDKSMNITGGLLLKTNSAFSPTSIGAGHTIIAGNLFAVMAITLLHWRKPYFFALSALVTIVTFSRGSWLILLVGVLLVALHTARDGNPIMRAKTMAQFLVGGAFVGLALYLGPFRDYMMFRVLNTLGVFGFVDNFEGTAYDPRTSEIWPRFIEQMNEVGFHAWVVGSKLTIPTDSGILLIFRESGGLGALFFLVLGVGLYIATRRDHLVGALLLSLLVGSVFNPVQQGYQLIFVVIFVAAIQSVCNVRRKERTMPSAEMSGNSP